MTKLKNVRIVIMKVLTHVRTHPEELLVSKIWISCFLFRLRLLARVKRKERSCTGRNGNTVQHCIEQLQWSRNGSSLHIELRSCLATGTFMARLWVKTRGKDCQHKHEASILCVRRNQPPDDATATLSSLAFADAWGLKNNKRKNASCKVLGKQYRFGEKQGA